MRGVAAKEIAHKFVSEDQAVEYAYNEGFIARSGNVFYRKSDRALAILFIGKECYPDNTLLVICR